MKIHRLITALSLSTVLIPLSALAGGDGDGHHVEHTIDHTAQINAHMAQAEKHRADGNHEAAGHSLSKAADLHAAQAEKHIAAGNHKAAMTAMESLIKIANLHTEAGNHEAAGHSFSRIADLHEASKSPFFADLTRLTAMNSYEKAGNDLEVAKLASKCLTSSSKKMLEDARDEKEKVKIISQYASEHIDIGKSLTNVAHKIETNDAKKAEHFIVAGHSHLKAAKVFSGIKDHKNAADNYDAAADAYKQGGKTKYEELAREKAANARSHAAEGTDAEKSAAPIENTPKPAPRAPRRVVVFE